MPKSDWTGLDDSAMKTYESPNQLRSSYASSAQKGYNHRKGGLSAKFGRGDDLALFQDNVMEHLKDTGMDTISYMPDPEDPDKMISVVLGHSRFTLSSVRGHSRLQVPFYDDYDNMNNRAAKQFLIASLSTELETLIKKKTQDDDTFPIVWMLLLQSIQSTSIEVYENP